MGSVGEMLSWLPRCLMHTVALPLHEILNFIPAKALLQNGLHFILLLSFVLHRVHRSFTPGRRLPLVWLQLTVVEDWVDPEAPWQLKLCCSLAH